MGKLVAGNCSDCVKATRNPGHLRRRKVLRLTTALVSATFFGMAFPNVASSANADWISGIGNWDDPWNWNTFIVPDSMTLVNVNGGMATIRFGAPAYSSNTIIDLGGEVDADFGNWENDGNSPGLNQRGGAIIVGDVGSGRLVILNGSTVKTTGNLAGSVLIGNQVGSNGTVAVVGGGAGTSTLENAGPVGHSGNFYVGYAGTGTLNVDAGGTVTGFHDMKLGIDPTGSGTLNVNEGTVDLPTSVLTVGDQGQGRLTVKNGGTVSTSAGFVTGNGSTATVTGTGSAWNLGTGGLRVGTAGSGTLTIDDHATVDVTAGSAQFYLAQGPGSGSMTVENGGTIKTNGAFIGQTTAGPTQVSITGAGSNWNAAASNAYFWTFSGAAGTKIDVTSGGNLTTYNAVVGDLGTADTSVTVDGNSSVWNNTDTIFLGYHSTLTSSTGTLNLVDGGTVSTSKLAIFVDGALNLGTGGLAGAFVGSSIVNNGLIAADFTDTSTLNAAISGSGVLAKNGIGTLTLNGVNTYTGLTTVDGGKLVLGDDSHATASLAGDVKVGAAGTLGGTGTIGGNTTIDGTLAPGNSPGTLTVAGDLTLNSGSTSVFELNTPGLVGGTGVAGNDLVDVTGNLKLGGALDAGVAAAGYYRLFNYGGTLSGAFDSGTLAGTGGFTPLSPNNPDIRTNIDHQVNLSVLAAGQTMQFWDGGDAVADATVDGGSGTWQDFATNWTNDTGSANGGWGGSVGVFAGSAGTVTVDGTQGFDTLQFSTDGYVLTGGTLALNPASGTVGTFNIDTGVSTTVASTIANGTGNELSKVGAGTLVLSGANTYDGGTRLLGGTLSVSSDANLGAASGALTFDGGTLQFGAGFTAARSVVVNATGGTIDAHGQSATLAGTIVDGGGPGVLTITSSLNNGIVAFNGNNTYSAATVVTNGAGLLASNPGSLSPNSAFTVNGVLGLTASNTIKSLAGGGLIGAGLGPSTLTIAPSSGTTDFSGKLTDFPGFGGGALSIVKSGAGTQTLSGANTYTGSTTVSGGTLSVNGSIASSSLTTVAAGGTLGGTGTVGTTTIASGGTLAPGNSIGTLNVAGNVAFAAGSIYGVEVDAAGHSDRTVATGTATIDGGTVRVLAGSGSYAPQTGYTILTAAGGRTGTFADATSNLAFLTPVLGYDANNVYLTMQRNDVSFAGIGGTPNQRATGAGAESTELGSSVYNAIASLSADQARAAFDVLSGEIHASAKSALVEGSRFVRDAINERIRAAFAGVGAGQTPVLAYGETGTGNGATAAIGHALAPADTWRFAAWGSVFGSWGSMNGDGNAAQLDRSTGGFVTGLDGLVAENVRLGIMTGYSHSSFDADDRASAGSSDNYHLGLYGGTQMGALGLRAGAAYTWHNVTTSRSVKFPGFADSLSADYDAGTFQAFGELGYRIDTATASFEPFANLAYVDLHSDAFAEKGGAAALTSAGQSTDATFTTLGIRASTSFDLGSVKTTARGMIGWRHAFGDTIPTTTNAFAGGNAFTIAGAPIAKDAAVLEAGLDFAISDNATLGVSYTGQFGSGVRDNGAKANLSVRF